MRIFFSRSPMVCLCLYVWAFHSCTDTWTTVSFSQFVFVDRTSNIWEFTSQSGGIFFFWMGTDKYDPVEMSTIKRTDEIKQCSRAQRITHQNKIYMRKWNLLLVGFCKVVSSVLFTTWFIFQFHWTRRLSCVSNKLIFFCFQWILWTTWYWFGWSRVENVIEYI